MFSNPAKLKNKRIYFSNTKRNKKDHAILAGGFHSIICRVD